MRLFCIVLQNKRPEKLYESIFDEEKDQVRDVTSKNLKKMTKLARKGWRIRVIRYAKIFPMNLIDLDLKGATFKREVKEWVKKTIPKEGDKIFKGKIEEKFDENDWLLVELEHWNRQICHELESFEEVDKLDESQFEPP